MTRLAPALTAGLILLAVGLALGWTLFRGDPDLALRLDQQEDSTALYRERVQSLEARADSVQTITVARVDTFMVWRTRWDTLTVHRTDTLTVPQVIAVADSVIRACDRALDSCMETVAAKDAALAVQAERVALLEAYRGELADRLKRAERWSWMRTVRDVAIGAAGAYAVCSLADC